MAALNPSSIRPGDQRFPATLWSLVMRAGEPSAAGAEEALATLCRAYWYPLYAYVRRQGSSPHDAQDLTQAFFAHLFARQRLGQVRRQKGRFRSFLLVSLRNFLSDERDKAFAQKRGGGIATVSLDAQSAEERFHLEPPDNRDPEKLFERRWAMTVLERVLERLEAEYVAAGKQARFTELQPFLLGDDDTSDYSTVARRLGMSVGAVKMAVLRLRQRSRELFHVEIANTVATEEDIEDEFRRLSAALAG